MTLQRLRLHRVRDVTGRAGRSHLHEPLRPRRPISARRKGWFCCAIRFVPSACFSFLQFVRFYMCVLCTLQCVTPPDANVMPTCPSSMPTAAAVAAAAVTAKITAMDVAGTTQVHKGPEPPAPSGGGRVRVHQSCSVEKDSAVLKQAKDYAFVDSHMSTICCGKTDVASVFGFSCQSWGHQWATSSRRRSRRW